MSLELYVTYFLCLKTVVSFSNTVDVYTTATLTCILYCVFVSMKISCLRKIISSSRAKTGGLRKNHT